MSHTRFTDYITHDRSELIDWLRDQVSPKRLAHILRVEDTAVQLACHYGLNETPVRIAALLHDGCKDLPLEPMATLARGYLASRPDLKALEERFELSGDAVWHGLAAAQTAYQRFGLRNNDILQAIAWHTTGYYQMTPLMQLIYVADYCEPGRTFPQAVHARQLAETNLTEATQYVLSQTLIHLIQSQQTVQLFGVDVYNRWQPLEIPIQEEL